MDKSNLAKPKSETIAPNDKRIMSHLERQFRQTHITEHRLRNKPEADHGRTSSQESSSSQKDLKIKPGERSAPKRKDAVLQVRQAIWQNQGQGERRASNPHQRTVQPVWRPKLDSSSGSHRGGRPFNAGLLREIPALAGGGDPDESSSQQQKPDGPISSRGSESGPSRGVGTRGHGTDNMDAITAPGFQYKLGQKAGGVYDRRSESGPSRGVGTRGHGTDNMDSITAPWFQYKLGQKAGGEYDRSSNQQIKRDIDLNEPPAKE